MVTRACRHDHQRQVALCGDGGHRRYRSVPTGHAHHLGAILEGTPCQRPGVLAWACEQHPGAEEFRDLDQPEPRNLAVARPWIITSAVRRGAGASAGSDMT